jgi:hypothetical protein
VETWTREPLVLRARRRPPVPTFPLDLALGTEGSGNDDAAIARLKL